jgi:hypothetical protein
MPTYLTPGIYRAPQPVSKNGLAAVRTDVAGFVGYTLRGPLPPPAPDLTFQPESVALHITSWSEFEANFGSFHDFGYLPFAVRAFFQNGGSECYVVRVAAVKAVDVAARPAVASFALCAATKDVETTLTASLAAGTFEVPVTDASAFKSGNAVQLFSPAIQIAGEVDFVQGNSVFLTERVPVAFDQASGVLRRYASSTVMQAKSPGAWGNEVWVTLSPLDASASSTRFSLRVTRPADEWSGAEEEFYLKLSIDPSDQNDDSIYAPTVLQRSNLVRLSVALNNDNTPAAAIPIGLMSGLNSVPQHLLGGRDGVAEVTNADFIGGPDDYRGLRLLEDIQDVAIVSIPDAVFTGPIPPSPVSDTTPDPCAPPPTDTGTLSTTTVSSGPPLLDSVAVLDLQLSLLEHCQRLRYRFAVLDAPPGLLPSEASDWAMGLRGSSGRFGALYYPWLTVPDPRSSDMPAIPVPPSGHVVGAYASNDATKGVRKPPANQALSFITDVAFDVDDNTQGDLNTSRVNCIRMLPGRGIRVWGARTLGEASATSWMFVHARRLMSYIEASVERSTRWTVFEPHDDKLRRALRHSLNVFLRDIWQSGGLKGATPEESYYVKCDETNNTSATIDNGQLICEAGVAVAAAMEFLVFEIRRNVDSAQVVEKEQT